jgi:hypothetical protein
VDTPLCLRLPNFWWLYDRPGQSAFCGRAARWPKSVNLDTIDLLEEVIQLSERHSSARDACVGPAWPKATSIFLGE